MRETRVFAVLAGLVAGTLLTVSPPASAVATTSTALISSPNPSVVGDPVTLTATVTGTVPTGTVTFKDDGNTLGSSSVDAGGMATLQVSTLTSGTHPLTATYNGDVVNDPSTSDPVIQVVTVPPTATTTALSSSANPSMAGQAVTLTAAVAGNAPTGTVTFAEAGTTLGVAGLAGGAASLVVSSLSVGSHAVTAAYSGDSHNLGSTGTLTQLVKRPVKKPVVRLTVNTTKVSVGQKIRLTWRTKRAETVTASGAWSGRKAKKGSALVRLNERGKFTFKLTATNASGKDTAKVKVAVARRAKELELVVTEELVLVGSDVKLTSDGLAAGERYTVRLDGTVLFTGKADKRGDVAKTFTVPKSTPEGALPLTITGSNPGRLGTAVLNVIRPKKLSIELFAAEIPKDSDQTVTVTGLLPGESVTLTYDGKELTAAEADASGGYSYTFNVGSDRGEKTVKVTGADPSRAGTATFKVVKPQGAVVGGVPGRHAPV